MSDPTAPENAGKTYSWESPECNRRKRVRRVEEHKYYSCFNDDNVLCCGSCHNDEDEGYDSIYQDVEIWACCAAYNHYDGLSSPDKAKRDDSLPHQERRVAEDRRSK